MKLTEGMKDQVLSTLTSSKNQRIVFQVVWERTHRDGKNSKCILNQWFIDGGIDSANPNVAISRACKALVEKGLIFKGKERIHRYDHDVYLYCIQKKKVAEIIGELNESK